jgi:hypothetical protein
MKTIRRWVWLGSIFSSLSSLVIAGTNCVTAPPGIIAWWPGNGSTNDVAGTNHAVLRNGAGYTNGLVGMGFAFDGVSSFVELPPNLFSYPTDGSGNAPFTFETWFQTSQPGGILGQQDGKAFEEISGWIPAVYVDNEGLLRVQMFYGDDLGINQLVTANSVTNGQFHHLAVTYDGTNETAYLDGAAFGTRSITQVAYAPIHYYQLGLVQTAAWPPGNDTWFPFSGVIDEPAVYGGALSPSEVTSIYAPLRSHRWRSGSHLRQTVPG